ncbi:4-(cytidine 5'-diphospho)-2-C-methyl-D-erythritol kinase [Parafrankia sp. EUN1f]|uniref:4-(cytidine 5'-diphospho)-2-C-methyl-D-erythritol kinase n=1 Tax=Parafrankia sp. EUN1f TaxID=102897 RepID=UPI000A058B75|nr:4-(cytidine 5'-diphospho)-2-C-methyl-D-erythritol kinase [Parafrankia sp. EUN1f]
MPRSNPGRRTAEPGHAQPTVTVRAPAKVNLHLGVGPLRADGYHEVTTVLQAVSLYDEITATSIPPETLAGPDGSGPVFTDEDPIIVTVGVAGEGARPSSPAGADGDDTPTGGDTPAESSISVVPTGRDNLAVRAAYLVAEAAGIHGEAAHLTLSKGIPVAAGMAGGSADAAAALVAFDALWGAGLDRATLVELASRLGSDVPFPLAGGTALGTGRGEQLTDVLGRGEYHWVFALADGGLSTPAVYAEFDRLAEGRLQTGPTPADAVLSALRSGSPEELGAALVNDLQPAALRLRPSLRRVLESGLELGAIGAIVSGSGPTCAFLSRDAAASVSLAASLAGMGVARAVRRAQGPVAGAQVLPPSSTSA